MVNKRNDDKINEKTFAKETLISCIFCAVSHSFRPLSHSLPVAPFTRHVPSPLSSWHSAGAVVIRFWWICDWGELVRAVCAKQTSRETKTKNNSSQQQRRPNRYMGSWMLEMKCRHGFGTQSECYAKCVSVSAMATTVIRPIRYKTILW